MNPMMMMAMASQKKRPAPTDRITNRPTKAQVAWIKAIEDDSTKEVIHVSEGSPVSLSVEVLDHSLSLSFNGPVLVTVVLDRQLLQGLAELRVRVQVVVVLFALVERGQDGLLPGGELLQLVQELSSLRVGLDEVVDAQDSGKPRCLVL